MARKRREQSNGQEKVQDYRHDAKRKNNPPAGLAAQGRVREEPKLRYAYDPHRPPRLRFDPTGKEDALPELVDAASRRVLTADEARQLADAIRHREPWLEWSGKQEAKWFEVDPVALHIHERISAQAILKVAAREDVDRDMFADPQLAYHEAVKFYEHDVDWSNRLILGDSLMVMASLARRENLAGKVQMIYMDPPYGIRFSTNFQPTVDKGTASDSAKGLTREPEMVKAYRDTWTLGVHSYLSYLRDRLILCRELLADSGSIFVQIGEENLHRVRHLMDGVFNAENCVAVIQFKKTGGFETEGIASICDYLLWFAKSKESMKFNRLYETKVHGEGPGQRYNSVLMPDGRTVPVSEFQTDNGLSLPLGARLFLGGPVTSDGAASNPVSFEFQGRTLNHKANQHWKTTPEGLLRQTTAERLFATRDFINYRLFLDDFAATPLTNMWTDTMGTAERDKVYVVQTTTRIVERCLLMASDPGDLVLDPTCGSGTTAYVAEQWGRRWITMDTSRVALSLARQRLLTATFPMFKTEVVGSVNPADGFLYKTVPHIMAGSIAQNPALDPIFERNQAILDKRLAALNAELAKVTAPLKGELRTKLARKEQAEGKRAVTDADRRRWLLPPGNRPGKPYTTVDNDFAGWYEWEVPFDTDPDWPEGLRKALEAYRAAWRSKMDEVNACIDSHAEPEELVDQPEVVRGVTRVSGPFTVEGVMPVERTLEAESPIGGAPEELDTFVVPPSGGLDLFGSGLPPEGGTTNEPQNAEAFIDRILKHLRADGVRFPDNKVMEFDRLEAVSGNPGFLHGEGTWHAQNEAFWEDAPERKVAVSVGPQFGPVTAYQVEAAIFSAARAGYDHLVFAGFSFDGAAQAAIQADPNPRVRCHLAQIRPELNSSMDGLLKESAQTGAGQLFTVFGQPRVKIREGKDGQFTATMEGVDIYDPVNNTLHPTRADKVAAWFLDSDYDGRTFCITQAFFPDKSAWEKLERALKGKVEEGTFDKFSGTVSLPFPMGKHKRCAVKVIDPRGNDVMAVRRLDGKYESGGA